MNKLTTQRFKLNYLFQTVQFRGRIRRPVACTSREHRAQARCSLRHRVSIAWLFQRLHNNSQTNEREYEKYVRSLSHVRYLVRSGIAKPYELSLQLDRTAESVLPPTTRDSMTMLHIFDEHFYSITPFLVIKRLKENGRAYCGIYFDPANKQYFLFLHTPCVMRKKKISIDLFFS